MVARKLLFFLADRARNCVLALSPVLCDFNLNRSGFAKSCCTFAKKSKLFRLLQLQITNSTLIQSQERHSCYFKPTRVVFLWMVVAARQQCVIFLILYTAINFEHDDEYGLWVNLERPWRAYLKRTLGAISRANDNAAITCLPCAAPCTSCFLLPNICSILPYIRRRCVIIAACLNCTILLLFRRILFAALKRPNAYSLFTVTRYAASLHFDCDCWRCTNSRTNFAGAFIKRIKVRLIRASALLLANILQESSRNLHAEEEAPVALIHTQTHTTYAEYIYSPWLDLTWL